MKSDSFETAPLKLEVKPKENEKKEDLIIDKYNFKTLTPNREIDIKAYVEAIDFVFDNDDLINIAISGQYGSGKSSILASYKIKHENRKFLHVSVAHFIQNSADEKANSISDNDNQSSILEWKILNQLVHQIDPERLMLSKFKTKKKYKFWNKRIAFATALFGSLILVGLYVIRYNEVKNFARTISNSVFKGILGFLADEVTLIVGVIILGILIVACIYYLLHLQKNNMLFKKIRVKDNEIEMFEEDKDSYFDHYLNEVLYIFDNIEEETVVFEDIDRFNDSGIFERLHEINRLVNLQQKKGKIIRFFYLIKDDVFITKDRTKFFDFIIPVVPVTDSSNAQDILLRFLKDSKMDSSIEARFIQDVSLYLDDMRIIKNIFNEYLIYNSRLKTSDLIETKLLAMIVYKNLFPRDFSELQQNSGLVYSIFEQKNQLVDEEIDQLKNQIESFIEDIKLIKNEVANSENELKALYLKLYPTYSGSSQIHQGKVDEYNRRKSLIEREVDIEELNREIFKIKERISELMVYPLSRVLSKSNIDEYFNEIEYSNAVEEITDFRDVKVNKYFDLLKYLIRNGYIDESYPEYMTYFYPESISREDKKFLRSVANQKKLESDYKLSKPAKIIENMDQLTIRQEEAQNFDLLEYLIINDFNSKNKELLVAFFIQIKEDTNYDFIYQFFNKKKASRTKLVRYVTERWNDFWNDVYLKNRLDDDFVKQFSLQLLINGAHLSKVNYNVDGNLSAYISSNENYLEISELTSSEEVSIINSIKKLNIKFKKIVNANKNLLSKIYSNNLYELTQFNVNLMLEEFYRDNIEIPEEKNYSTVMNQNDSYLAKYVTLDKITYLSHLFSETTTKLSDEIKWYLDIVNDENLTKEVRKEYINRSELKVESIVDILEIDLWSTVLSKNQVDFSEINLYDYYLNVGDKEPFATFVNSNDIDLNISLKLEEKEKYSNFFEFVVGTNQIDNDKYKQLVNSFSRFYNQFSIKNVDEEKIDILIDLNTIRMAKFNLEFLRENYPNNLLKLIQGYFDDYVNVLTENSTLVIQEELEKLLLIDLDDSQIKKLLILSTNSIAIRNKGFKDSVISLILDASYDVDELTYLFEEYENFSDTIKSKINIIAIEHDDILVVNIDVVSKHLIFDLLKNVFIEMTQETKVQLFIRTITLFKQKEISKLFEVLNLEDYIDFFDFVKRPRLFFEANEFNQSILEALKSAGLISDYSLIHSNKNYVVKRKKI